MEKEISTIRNKMIVVICVIVALSTWQHEFIVSGVMSHLYMNLTILGTFAFGLVTAFMFISRLKNEVVALNALQEMWDDIRVTPEEAARDPARYYSRCTEPARVFRRPRLLGHAYDLVTEELARTKRIRVSLETMNTLVHKIEETINDEKSLIVYISGLLVFMGLIGTFIGLLHMVGAIGGIIGSLANSGDSGQASGAFQKLLGALEEPLKGMASGFASSLFGLFSSLVVGLMGRFAGQAANVLKGAFESWLAEVVQIGNEFDFDEIPASASASVAPLPTDEALVRMVGAVLKDYTRVAGGFEQAARALQDMRATQETQGQGLIHAIEALGKVQASQTRILEEISAVGPTTSAVREIGASVEAMGHRLVERLEIDGARTRESLQAIERAHDNGLRSIFANQTQTSSQISRSLEQLSEDIERRIAIPSLHSFEDVLERGLRGGLNSGLSEANRALKELAQSSEARLVEMTSGQELLVLAMTEALSAKEPNAEPQNVAKALEIAVSEGFARLSQTMETAFAAYSSLVHVAVGALERKSGDATTPGMNKGDAGAEAPSRPRDASPLRA